VREDVVKKTWVQVYENDDLLLFGSRKTTVDLSTLHPEAVQIFKLWQIYLDNINPLLKVTHTPSLQGRIIEAASNIKTTNPNLEALMFSIYCMSIQSLDEDDCQSSFASTKEDLLTRYQFGCQQALLNSEFLRSSDRDCLTALYLYLVSSLATSIFLANKIRFRSGQVQFLNLYPPYLAWQSALHSVWVFTASRRYLNALFLRPKCAEDFGGRLFSLTVASAN
jgi:hypothetical protein